VSLNRCAWTAADAFCACAAKRKPGGQNAMPATPIAVLNICLRVGAGTGVSNYWRTIPHCTIKIAAGGRSYGWQR
jgi:hypothetical protein